MQTNTQESSGLERRLDMSVPMADIDKEVESRLKRMSGTVKMAGFRPGKVPFKMVAQQYGPQVRMEALNDAVHKAFGEAVREQNLRVAGYPRIEPKEGSSATHFEFSAVFEVYPEFKPGDVSQSEIERPVLEVGDAEIDKTIEVLRKQRTRFEAVERAAQDEDRVVIDFLGKENGVPFQGGEASDFPFILGKGQMLPDFEKNVSGMTAGQDKTFEMTFPDDYHAELAGKTVSFDIKVKGVEAPVLPEVDAEFARALGIADGDVSKMREEIASNLKREVKSRIQGRVKNAVMETLLAANPIEVPKALVESEAQSMADNAKRDLESRGFKAKDMPVKLDWFTDQAQRRVTLGLVIAELVQAEKLQANPDQIKSMIDEFAQSYERPEEVVKWHYAQPQRLAEIEALVIESNVVDWVLARAKVADKPIDFDELMNAQA